ncbi:MAG: MBL fold metallo-hydrolase [Myxococcota bacterium]|jgi:phosphoribosyl 1,2-cyclic phosphodiesterase|nr:MBL fold metallo-hydrolase [Myxococcota bacterium]
MEIHFWGNRGSIPSPGPETVRYGGNTTCVEIRNGDDYILIDAGTGIRKAGEFITRERGGNQDIPLLVTHTHWDHIQGLPFFIPAFIPGNRLRIFGPHNHQTPFDRVIADQMQFSYFPVNFAQLRADISPRTLREGESFQLGSITVIPKYVNHPVPTLGYRFEADGKSIVFLTDIEPYRDVLYDGICPSEEEREEFEEVQKTVIQQNQRIVDFCKETDILVIDAQYTHEEYERSYIGWGHTSMRDALQIGRSAGAKTVVFTHHDPNRSDDDLDRLLGEHAEQLGRESGHSVKQLLGATERTTLKA